MFEERWGKKRESHCAGFTRSGQANEGVFHNIEVPVPGTFLLGMDVDLSVKVDRRQCDYICKVISDIVFAPSYSMDRNRDGSRIGAIAGSQEQKGNGSPFDVAACASEGQNTVDVKDQGAISRANYWRAGPGVNTIHSVPVDYKTYIGHTGYLPVQKQAWETHWDHTAGLTDNEFYRTVPVVDQTGRLAKTDPLGDASNQGLLLEKSTLHVTTLLSDVEDVGDMVGALSAKRYDSIFPASHNPNDFTLQYGHGLF
ncbi:Hypothetical protein D9617_44g038890 [Elsinoe fawcettii]|nr:Hypothetical protein D9617_44g038890 [Elsinoe fawcettii]